MPPPLDPAGPPALSSRPSLGLPKFPRGLTTLCVAWLHGRLEAVAVQRGDLLGTWECPEPVPEAAGFAERLRQAAAATDYRGSTVTMLLAHPRLIHQFLEVPPAKGAAIQALLQRQVERLKVFEGEPAWCYQRAIPTKTSQSALVHLFPKRLLDQLAAETKRAGFNLVSVIPATAALHDQLSRLPLKPEDVALLAADVGGTTIVVVGRQDGEIALARSLDAARSKSATDLAVDLNRTVLFVAQQFGVTVGSVWVFGQALSQRVPELQTQLQVPVRPSPEECPARYWGEAPGRLPAAVSPSLISAAQREEPKRRIFFRIVSVLTGLLVLAALGMAAFCELQVRSERRSMQELARREVELVAQHQDLQRQDANLQRRAQVADVVIEQRPAPVPVWFVAYLSEAVPPDLLVTNVLVEREGEEWQARVAGVLQSKTGDGTLLESAVELFRQRLATGPFRMRFVEPGTIGAPTSGVAAATQSTAQRSRLASLADLARSLATPPAGAGVATATRSFVIEGRMR